MTLLVAAALPLLLMLSCGGDDAGPAGPGGTSQPTTLLQDTFDGPGISTSWLVTTVDATADIDGGMGQPAPSLHARINAAAPAAGFARLLTNAPFNNASGLTFSVFLFVNNPGRTGGNADNVGITLIDQGRLGAGRGSFGYHRNSIGGVTITYSIAPGGSPTQIAREDVALATGFHEFRFVINPDRSARWLRDGVQKLATLPGIQMLEADIQLQLDVAGVGSAVSPDQSAGHFDTVTITRP